MFTEVAYEDRLASWKRFRDHLEEVSDPVEQVIKAYGTLYMHSLTVDPWDILNWPTPWILLYENRYCNFTKILGIGYTLGLLQRFDDKSFEIVYLQNHETGTIEYKIAIDNAIVDITSQLPNYSILEKKTLEIKK